MKLKVLYIVVFATILVALGTPSAAAVMELSPVVPQVESPTENCQVTILQEQNKYSSPFSNQSTEHGGAGSTYISISDAVPHISVTSISSLTFAVVIALVNNDEHKPTPRSPVVPRQTVLHKVLFRSIISPNAP